MLNGAAAGRRAAGTEGWVVEAAMAAVQAYPTEAGRAVAWG